MSDLSATPAGSARDDGVALRAVIVDDEPLAREGLAADLRGIRDSTTRVDVVGQAANAFGAIDVIRRERPDVLFLDIEMPEMNGFDLLAQLEPEELPPAVIVVTAYDQHALRGFDANALDFLLKPYPLPRLLAAVERAAARVRETVLLHNALEHETATASAPTPTSSEFIERILVTERERTIVVTVQEVEWIEAQSYYARIHAPPKAWLIRERMSVLARSLDPAQFFRTHRSAIVRIDAVRAITAVSRYEHEVRLASGATAPLARTQKRALSDLLSKIR